MKIIVFGYIVRGPMGGMTWHHLQYVLGLKALGFKVYYFEDSGDSEFCCYNPKTGINSTDPRYGLRYAGKIFKRFGLDKDWAYYDAHTKCWHGPLKNRKRQIFKSVEMMLNLSCSNDIRDWTQDISIKVLVDTDPVFTQIRNLKDSLRRKLSTKHNRFFTYGENFMNTNCSIPDDGIKWLPTRQPVVMDFWPVYPGPQNGNFTTVMQWQSYTALTYKNQLFGVKDQSFMDFLELPKRVDGVFEIALGSPSAPRNWLKAHGWHLSDPFTVTSTPLKYRLFIKNSKAEFSVSKHAYVISKSGWFSERSAVYLASGRPVLVQDTGFSEIIETGMGLISFSKLEEAIEGVNAITNKYKIHSKYARDIAERFFDSRLVLKSLIERAMRSDTW